MKLEKEQKYLEQHIFQGMKNKEKEINYVDKLTLSLIEPHERNKNYNKETTFPTTANLTDYYNNDNTRNTDINRNNGVSGWIYSEEVSLSNGDLININNQELEVVIATYRNINKREVIFRDTSTNELCSVNLKKLENLDEMYKIVKDLQEQNKLEVKQQVTSSKKNNLSK
jgi:hypothetical protein